MLTAPAAPTELKRKRSLDLETAGARVEALPLLVDGLLHDARNPLNALSINLEIMAERLRRESGGAISPTHEKNIRAIREQIHRIDAILRQFAEFIAPRAGAGPQDLSALVAKALEVVGHEARSRRIKLEPDLEPAVKARCESGPLHDLVLHALLRGLARAPSASGLRVRVCAQGEQALLRVEDSGADPVAGAELLGRIEALCETQHGQTAVLDGALELRLPLA